MGISIKSQDIFMAAAAVPTDEGRVADAVDGAFGKIAPSSNLTGASQLLDLKNQVQADLREWGATTVGLLDTGKHAQWVYSQAQRRILSISAVMYACAEENIEFHIIKPGDAGRAVGSPKLDKIQPEIFGLANKPTFWTTGLGEAYAAAIPSLVRGSTASKA